jgi:outer membrane protein OmpA-like peptidoglycan-associated protein/uncharacterized protein YceK
MQAPKNEQELELPVVALVFRNALRIFPMLKRIALPLAVVMVTTGCSQVPDAINPVEWYKNTADLFVDKDERQTRGVTPLEGSLAADRLRPTQVGNEPYPDLSPVPARPQVARAESREWYSSLADFFLDDDESYPDLSSVPARPQVTRAETKTQIAEGLVADTPQAGYSSEVILRQGATAGSLMALAPVAQRQVAPEIAKGIRPLPLPTVKPLLARQRVAALPEKPRKPVVQASAVASSVADVFRARVAEQSRLPSQMTSEAGAGVQAGLGVVGILERPSAPVVSSTAVASSIADVFRARIAEQSRLPLQVASGDGSGVQAGLGGTVYISSAGVVGPANAGRQVSLPHFGMEKVATIIFSNGSWKLSETDLKILADVSALHRLRGGAVNVVGHASSRTKTMDEGRHHQVNLKISLSRADSVARALIRMGLPRNAISIDARADSEPLYHEVMPTGEAGNRRAEIYLEL